MRRALASLFHAVPVSPPTRSRILSIDSIEIFVREWGQADAPVVFAWHGLGRTGSDIGPLATALSSHFRVVSPDLPGRGLSSWLSTPSEYAMEHVELVATEIIKATVTSRLESFRMIGTSMGGMLGIVLAGKYFKDRVSHLVINDIGPQVPKPAVDRILNYSRLVAARC
jgi:pimeloyl-ACP methyl ester carboxylesterase